MRTARAGGVKGSVLLPPGGLQHGSKAVCTVALAQQTSRRACCCRRCCCRCTHGDVPRTSCSHRQRLPCRTAPPTARTAPPQTALPPQPGRPCCAVPHCTQAGASRGSDEAQHRSVLWRRLHVAPGASTRGSAASCVRASGMGRAAQGGTYPRQCVSAWRYSPLSSRMRHMSRSSPDASTSNASSPASHSCGHGRARGGAGWGRQVETHVVCAGGQLPCSWLLACFTPYSGPCGSTYAAGPGAPPRGVLAAPLPSRPATSRWRMPRQRPPAST